MRKIALYALLLIVIACLIPFVDGYLFRNIFNQQIAILQTYLEREASKDAGVSLTIRMDSYRLGWLQSEASLSLIVTSKSQPETSLAIPMKADIKHGPFINFDHNIQTGYAAISASIFLPNRSGFLPKEIADQPLVMINTKSSLNGKDWVTLINIAPKIFDKIGAWDGFTSTVYIRMNKNYIETFTSNTVIGKCLIAPQGQSFFPDITVEPTIGNSQFSGQSLTRWTWKSNTRSAGMSVQWPDKSKFALHNFLMDSTSNMQENNLRYDLTSTIESIQLPSSFPITQLMGINFTAALHDFNYTNDLTIRNIIKNRDADEAYKIIKPESKIGMQLDMQTELGGILGKMAVSFTAQPKSAAEINDTAKIKFDLKMAQPLARKLMETYIAHLPAASNQAIPSLTQTVLAEMLQKNYLAQDKNDYLVSIDWQANTIQLNGKIISKEEFNQIPAMISSTISNTTGKQTLPATPTLPEKSN